MKKFQTFDQSYTNRFTSEFKGELDVARVLDLSHVSDNPQTLMKEIANQPALYAYWSQLRIEADRNYEQVNHKFTIFQLKFKGRVLEYLKAEGISKPTIKQVDQRFHELYKDQEWYKKISNAVKVWKVRKENLTVVEKSVAERGIALRNLSYIVSHMMQTNLMPK